MNGKKYTLILVPETHWDREWYGTFQEFRIRLVRVTDKLLYILETDPEYRSFTFDGQTVVLEDYLQIRPQERERIKKLVHKGRLLIGPWYILPDEFLASAEATVRNLMLGHKIGEEFGRTMKAGYIPDPFGHVSQLPQILVGFGIGSVFFTRGMGDEADEMTSEFWWEAPDGTKILAVNQVNGYCNASELGYERTEEGIEVNFDKALQQVTEQLDTLAKKASTSYLLLNNGCDHLEPQPELPEIIKHVNRHLKKGAVIHSTYEDYAQRVLDENPDLATYKGELHRGKFYPLLPGVLSSRMYLKQANERTQTLLEKWAEPWSALAWTNGGTYDADILWEAWKLCIKNHPHDSICGCSIDQVHREMMGRFEQAQQIGQTMTDESLQFVGSKVDTSAGVSLEDAHQAIVAFNPHAWDVTDTVKAHVEKPVATGEPVPRYIVKDAYGNVIPTQMSNEHIHEINRHHYTWHGDVCFAGKDIPSLGYKTFYLTRGSANAGSSLQVGLDFVENDFVKVNARGNGTFDLFHKQTRTTFHNLNALEDTEDVGDEYNYGRAYNSRTITSEGARGTVSIVGRGRTLATVRADFVLRLPESITPDRLSRSETVVDCPATVYITVHANSARVDIVMEFENNAKDHRLRAHFPTGIAADVCFAEGQFDVVERSLDLSGGQNWMEKPVAQNPVQSFVAVDGTDGGLAVINQGMPEYEVIKGEPCTIVQTLLRCCGWLSRDDYQARPYNAGPCVPTPDAQCLGKHVLRYAVLPYQANWSKAKAWRQAHQHNVPVRTVLTGIHKGELPEAQSLASVSPGNLVVTTLKKAEKSDSLVVRVLNTTPDAVEANVTISREFKSAVLANLNEEPVEENLTVEGNTVTFPMPGFRVQTVLFSF